MTDIIERLRALQTRGMLPVITEAADEIEQWRSRFEKLQAVAFSRAAEIERLTAEHKSLGAHLAHLGDNNDKLRADNERLTAAAEVWNKREIAQVAWIERLQREIEQLRRWVYATARSLEQSGLSLEEYNAITAEVCHALEHKP